jgi:SAM-dependent methyltransferase
MTGLDFSRASLAQASRLAVLAEADVTFVESNVYEAVDALGGATFDFIFTGVGALCWLPDIRRWAEVVSRLLAPGGWLFIRDGHPMLGTIEAGPDGQLVVEHSYFERREPFVSVWDGTYVETAKVFENTVAHEWNHGIGEIVTALLDVGMQLTILAEHDTVPWEAIPGQMLMVAANEWQLADRPWRVAHSFTLRAVKPA